MRIGDTVGYLFGEDAPVLHKAVIVNMACGEFLLKDCETGAQIVAVYGQLTRI